MDWRLDTETHQLNENNDDGFGSIAFLFLINYECRGGECRKRINLDNSDIDDNDDHIDNDINETDEWHVDDDDIAASKCATETGALRRGNGRQ